MSKRILEADSNQCSIPKKVKKWGSNKEDLQTVQITSIGSSKQTPSPSDISKLKYKPFGSEKECTAAINLYKNCRLSELLKNNNDQIESTLKPLKEQIQPLKYLFQGHNDCWDIHDVHSKEMEIVGLSRKLLRAFLFSMDDSSGKEAVKSLVEKIITLSQLNLLEVIQTGSSSHMTCFATSLIFKNLFKDSSSSCLSSTKASEEDSSPERRQRDVIPVTQQTRVTRRASKDTNISPKETTSSDSYKPKRHFSTSDVLVFHWPQMNTPMQTKLVISVKKGSRDGISDLIKQLLSRLPYQSGWIFGLHVNALEATICSVKHELEGEDPSQALNVCIYEPYTFKKIHQPFSVESFWDMTLDIGTILNTSI